MTADRDAIQRRTLRVLTISQILGGVGVGAGLAVGSLIAEDVSGSTALAGLTLTSTVLGAAVIALPLARLMSARGRRPGLVAGYLAALAGAVLMIAGAVVGSLALVLLGAGLLGAGTATNLQSRYAAADLSHPQHRARDLARVVWATTIGVVLGPNLTGPGATVADSLGLPPLTGPLVFTVAGFAVAAVLLQVALRPDPLLTARGSGSEAGQAHVPLRRAIRAIAASRNATLALVAVATAHTVMVSVMVMTPVHLRHQSATLEVVGLVISLHVTGMYAFSPIMGWLTDRLGRITVLMLGQAVLVAAVAVSGAATSHLLLGMGLLLLGLGWSAALIAGSTLLSESVADDARPGAQGASDFVMGIFGAAGGALAGVVLDLTGYGTLNVLACALVLPVLLLAAVTRVRPTTTPTPTPTPTPTTGVSQP